MPLVIPIVVLYKSTRCDRRNLYSSFPFQLSAPSKPQMPRPPPLFKMLSQRIIPLLLDHKDVIRCQGLAVRDFRIMMAQKVHLPLLFSETPGHR